MTTQIKVFLFLLFLFVASITNAQTTLEYELNGVLESLKNKTSVKSINPNQPQKAIHYKADSKDNTKWVVSDTAFYTYNHHGNVVMELQKDINDTNKLLKQFTYDSNNNLTLKKTFIWDTSAHKWNYSIRDSFNFDSHGYTTLFDYSNWNDSSKQWEHSRTKNSKKYTYFYRADDKINQVIMNFTMGPDTAWYRNVKDFRYNEIGLLISVRSKEFQWERLDSFIYNNKTELVAYNWVDFRNGLAYNKEMWFNIVWQKWNQDILNAKLKSASNFSGIKEDITYLENGGTHLNYQIIGPNGDCYVTNQIIETTFDYNLNQTSYTYLTWYLNSMQIHSAFKKNYTYNSNNLPLEIIEQGYDGYDFYNRGKTIFEDYITTPTIEIIEKKTKIFPNPSRENFTIITDQSASVNIFNLLGETIYTNNENFTQTIIDCKDWPVGTYIIHLRDTQGHITTKKFIKD
ncbi:MAG: Secretion system C-terminal sorting domain [Bacteroidota bacterium]|jgi:hypothetical protein